MSRVLCPRCQRDEYTPYGEEWVKGDPLPPALSRVDNETYICSACGQDEAIRDLIHAAPIPPDEWPVEQSSWLLT